MARTLIAPNLYILDKPSGERYYITRFYRDGKQIERSLGNVKVISLREAKMKMNQLMLFGDPEKDAPKKVVRFKDIVEPAIEAISLVKQWRSPISRPQFEQNMRDYVVPIIGDMDIEEIDSTHILKVLTPIWFDKVDTATRVRYRIESIFAWAIHQGIRKNRSNPATWKSNLEFDLPMRNRIKQIKHHEAMTLEETRKVIQYCLANPCAVNAAIIFGICTASRVNEFVLARWEEIEDGVWSLPPERRKDGKPFPHRVPLSSLAKKALKMAGTKEGLVFVGRDGKKHISKESPRAKLRDIICRPVTMHGCRSTFRDWCAINNVEHAVAEKALSHKWGNEVTAAYLREDLLDKRRELMQRWADVLLGKVE